MSSSEEVTLQREVKKEFDAVMDSSSSSRSAILLGYNNKKLGETSKGGTGVRLPSQSPPTHRGVRQRSHDSNSSSGSDGREGGYTVNRATNNMAASPSQKRANPSQQWSPKVSGNKFGGSSDGVASAIQEILSRRSSTNEFKIPATDNSSPKLEKGKGSSWEDSTERDSKVSPGPTSSTSGPTEETKARSNSEPNKTTDSSKIAENLSLASTSTSTTENVKGGVAKTRALFEKMASIPSMEIPPAKSRSESTCGETSVDVLLTGQRSASFSSDVLSSEGVATDVESNRDILSPPPTQLSPTHSQVSPTHTRTSRSHPLLEQTSPRRSLSNSSMPNLLLGKKKLTASNSSGGSGCGSLTIRDDFGIEEDEEEEEGDTLGEMKGFDLQEVRARTNTISCSTLKDTTKVGVGRKKLKDQRKQNILIKRATSQISGAGVVSSGRDFSSDMTAMKHDFELLSPLLGAKIKNMALKRIYDSYGGKEVVKRAVEVIAQAWQTYSLRKQFQKRLKEKSQSRVKMRERAKSMRQVARRPSIMHKDRVNKNHYRKVDLSKGVLVSDKKTVDLSKGVLVSNEKDFTDPMARMREKADRLGKERSSHTHTGSRLELMEKKRSSFGIGGGGTGTGTGTGTTVVGTAISESGETTPTPQASAEGQRLPTASSEVGGASVSKDSIDLSSVDTLLISGLDTPTGEDAVFPEADETETSLKNKNPMESSLSVTEIEMQLDSSGLNQCKDSGFPSKRANFSLGLSNFCRLEEDDDDDDSTQAGEISLSLSTSDFQRPVSVFSESSFESTMSAPNYSSLKSPRRAGTLPHPHHLRRASVEERERTARLKVGIYHFNRKPTKGIQYFVRNELLEDDPKSVAVFLLRQEGLCKEKIGEFLGAISCDFNMAVLESLVELVNIGDQPIDEALREFQRVFRMPGEAQKIDKIMEVFAMEYFKKNQSARGVFRNEDGAYILSFSIMMLHTSLHNPSVKNRTSKKQWLSMNRGTNDGENFPDNFLLDIFDRIQANEFATGKDHTHKVAELEKQIIGSPIENLCTSQRHLIYKGVVTELEIGGKSGFKNRHKRWLFLFSDIVMVCSKRRHQEQYIFKETFSLPSLQYIKFEASNFKYGIQLHAQDRAAPYQFNCDNHAHREDILRHLDDILDLLQVLESERIAELGNTLSATSQDVARAVTSCNPSNAGDLITTRSLTMDSSSVTKKRGDYVEGVGDLAISLPSSLPRQFSKNRISQDSGFISQQLTPTPPLSPALNVTSDMEATPASSTAPDGTSYSGPRSVTPNAPSSSHMQSSSLLAPTSSGPIRSKSTDGIHKIGLTSSNGTRSPSMEFPGKRRSSGQSNGNSPLIDPHSKKKKKDKSKGFFGFGKGKSHKEGSSSGGNGSDSGKKTKHTLSLSRTEKESSNSPQNHRKLVQATDSIEQSLEDNRSELTKTLPH